MTTVDEYEFLYDENGNPVRLCDCDLEWTNGRQLKSVTADSVPVLSFTYDENGNGVASYMYNAWVEVVIMKKFILTSCYIVGFILKLFIPINVLCFVGEFYFSNEYSLLLLFINFAVFGFVFVLFLVSSCSAQLFGRIGTMDYNEMISVGKTGYSRILLTITFLSIMILVVLLCVLKKQSNIVLFFPAVVNILLILLHDTNNGVMITTKKYF